MFDALKYNSGKSQQHPFQRQTYIPYFKNMLLFPIILIAKKHSYHLIKITGRSKNSINDENVIRTTLDKERHGN